MHSFSNLFYKLLYMFRTRPLSIIRSISTLYTSNRYLSCQFCWLSASVVRMKIIKLIKPYRKRGRRDDKEERRKQLMDDVRTKRRYWSLKEEALDRTLWRTRFGIGCGLSQDRLRNDYIYIPQNALQQYLTLHVKVSKTVSCFQVLRPSLHMHFYCFLRVLDAGLILLYI